MRKVGVLAAVVLGVSFLMNAVGYLSNSLTLVTFDSVSATLRSALIAGALLPIIASVAAGAYLIRRRELLAQWWFPEADQAPTMSLSDVVRGGLVLIGVYLMVLAIPTLLREFGNTAVAILQIRSNADAVLLGGSIHQVMIQSVPSIVGTLVSFALGWFLIAHSTQLTARFVDGSSGDESKKSLESATCPSCGAAYDPADYDGALAVSRCASCKEPLELPHA